MARSIVEAQACKWNRFAEDWFAALLGLTRPYGVQDTDEVTGNSRTRRFWSFRGALRWAKSMALIPGRRSTLLCGLGSFPIRSHKAKDGGDVFVLPAGVRHRLGHRNVL